MTTATQTQTEQPEVRKGLYGVIADYTAVSRSCRRPTP